MSITRPMPDVACLALPLAGWDRCSMWGWDATGGRMFARLWPNTDDPDMPSAIRIGPGEPREDGACQLTTVRVEGLAELIASATATSVPDVLLAMAAGAPRALQNQLRNLAAAHQRGA